MLAYYFTRKCDMCDFVKNNTEILEDLTEDMEPPMSLTILDAIRLRYYLKPYNVRYQKNLSQVQDWAEWSDNMIPAVKIDSRGKVEKYVGVKDMEELARKCVKWFRARRDKRPEIITPKTHIDLRQVEENA